MTLEIITAEALAPLRHGFFTRKGGASSGIYQGLNCGPGSQDQADMVTINRTRVASALGVDADHLATVNQIHSAAVEHVTGPVPASPRPKADALVTATPGLAIAVLTADCQPVLFADAQAGVVGATHAGWKGALVGVLEETLSAMEVLGAARERVVAVIGPTISADAYEVGPEFRDRFLDDDSANALYFVAGSGDRWMFDLPGYSLARLDRAGVGHATWTGACTYSDPARFYSYRRSVHRKEPDYGRLISAIRL